MTNKEVLLFLSVYNLPRCTGNLPMVDFSTSQCIIAIDYTYIKYTNILLLFSTIFNPSDGFESCDSESSVTVQDAQHEQWYTY